MRDLAHIVCVRVFQHVNWGPYHVHFQALYLTRPYLALYSMKTRTLPRLNRQYGLDIMKETAIESCRKWENAGQPKSGPIHGQYKKNKLP